MADRRLAVIDLGSNSFRLVVFTWGEHGGHGWWRRTDEIYEAVRVGEGLDAAGELQPEPMERALETIELFARTFDSEPCHGLQCRHQSRSLGTRYSYSYGDHSA